MSFEFTVNSKFFNILIRISLFNNLTQFTEHNFYTALNLAERKFLPVFHEHVSLQMAAMDACILP